MSKTEAYNSELTDLYQKFELLVINTEKPCLLIDTDFKIISFNTIFKNEYLKYFGIEFKKGAHIFDLVPKERIEILKKIYAEVLQGETLESQVEIPIPGSAPRIILSRYKPALNEKGEIAGILVLPSDITEIIKTEQLQYTTEKRFQSLIENAQEIISLTNKDGHIIYISPSVTKITGYTLEELKDGKHSDKMNPADIENQKKILAELLQNPGVPFYKLYSLIHKNGNIIWMEGTVTNLLDNENVRAIVSNFRNVTERKEAEEKLKESENNLKAIFNNSTEAFMLLDNEFKIRSFNAKADDNHPYNSRSLETGVNLMDYIEDSRKGYFSEYLNRVLNGETIEYDTHYSDKEGNNKRWFHAVLSPVKEDNIIKGICITRRDITEKKIIEENIKIAKERYDIVAKATNDAIYDWDLKSGEVIRTGDGLKVLFGYSETDAKEVDFWKKRIHPGDLDAVIKKLDLLLSQPDQLYCNQEYRFLKADGTYAFVFDKGFIIRNNDGVAIRMIGATQDITHRKETELLLKNLNENLEIRAKELADSNTELEQFAYTASHDLQEPLRMITSFLAQLELKYKERLDEKARQYIFFASDGASRMRKIILDLLEYSVAGRKAVEMESINIKELLIESMQLNRKIIEEKNATVNCDKMPVIYANRASILQVFQNLIGNSLKYQKPAQKPIVNITATETNTHWQFSFSDNGIGIEQQFFEKIFVAFQRLHNRSEYDGTGLGLAICKKIVENHGGRIWVESTINTGSTFYFTILKNNITAN